MSCSQWEKRVALHARGDLPEREAEAVEVHLRACAGCRVLAGDIRESLTALESLAAVEPDAQALAELRARVLGLIGVERPRGRRILWAWGAAAACLLFLAALLWPIRTAPEPPHRAALPRPSVRPAAAAPALQPARPVYRRRARRARPAAPTPLVVKLLTDDPDVVVYWIVERKLKGD